MIKTVFLLRGRAEIKENQTKCHLSVNNLIKNFLTIKFLNRFNKRFITH